MARKIYIAGPMSGYKDFNFAAFRIAAKTLRDEGYEVVNPAEICPELGKDWAYYMRKDIAELLNCNTIYLLKFWWESKGASLEKHIAETLGMEMLYEGEGR